MKNNKIGILTIQDNNNYGNRLQNYAVSKIFSICNVTCENIVIKIEGNTIKYLLKKIIPFKLFETLKYVLKRNVDEIYRCRMKNFDYFTAYMKNKYYNVNKIKHLKNKTNFSKYELCFVGSDQVWNPDFAGQDYYFLNFVEPHKRIAFAASIGYEELPSEVLERYTAHWKQMHYISVREDSSADIIEKATGKRPDVFLDPTLLLTREEWNEVVKQPKCNIPKKYILCLFLGKMPEYIKEAYKNAYGIELIILNDKTFPDYYVQGPSEFIWLVQNAELVLTDSFHCSVFSIIYHKQFWVFEREDEQLKNMFTRIETLLNRFDMMDRIQKRDAPVSFEKISEERFTEKENIRRKERDRVLQIIGDIVSK